MSLDQGVFATEHLAFRVPIAAIYDSTARHSEAATGHHDTCPLLQGPREG